MIVQSTYTEGPVQADGRRWVREVHTTTEDGDVVVEWLGTQDAQMVMEERALVLNAQYAKRAEARAMVASSLIPWTHREFTEALGSDAKRALDRLEATFETDPKFDESTRDLIRSGFKDFYRAQNIARPLLPEVLAMLGLLQALNLITQAQVASVLEASNG